MPTTSLYPESVHAALRALFTSLGTPVRTPATVDQSTDMFSASSGRLIGPDDCEDVHPVFGLAEHFQGHDNGDPGYTHNPFRGDHLSVPCYTEGGGVFVLDISFHKGSTMIEQVAFPGAPSHLVEATYSLLDKCETR
jgi:hypothetical protein